MNLFSSTQFKCMYLCIYMYLYTYIYICIFVFLSFLRQFIDGYRICISFTSLSAPIPPMVPYVWPWDIWSCTSLFLLKHWRDKCSINTRQGLHAVTAKESGVIANTVVMIKVHFILFYFILFSELKTREGFSCRPFRIE